ncbi:hypothetical protein [Clostridium sp. Marseille-P2415]|uniref:hypothetical protein n=1 Tax=Clostridium sp. Marseille-P2415 TaxID=1805471 RepID=UPI0013566295|nr:hypothetical protein [Clostridium sp. Marseille-P2415]
MKRFIIIFSFLMFLILFSTNYSAYNTESYNKLINSSSAFGFELTIPEDDYNSTPEFLQFLKQSAVDNDVNLVRTVSYYNSKTNTSHTVDYIYLVTDTVFFKNIDIKGGRILSVEDMDDSSVFMSTEKTDSDKQIAIISDFGGGHYYSIHVLDHILTQYKYSGKYRVECNSYAQFTKFVDDYISYLEFRTPGVELTRDMFTSVNNESEIKIENTTNLLFIIIFFFTIMFLTFMFYLVSKTKEISVMRLNGYNIREVCLHVFINQFVIITVISNIIILLLILLIPNNNIEFVIRVYATNIFVFLFLFFLLSYICAIYTRNIKTTYCIKGKKPISAIILFIGVFKVVVSVVIILLAVNLVEDKQQIDQKKHNLVNWTNASNYGVFYPVKTGNDSADIRSGKYPLDIPAYNLYPFLNKKMQSIYINSDLYTNESIELNANNDYIREISVNPNYLIEHPIYDENGMPIKISEDTPYTIYLVPEQYRDKEEYYYKYFSHAREQYHELHTGLYNQEAKLESLEVVFIYTQSGQEIFSYNYNVLPENNNLIPDPIIYVMTEANSLVPDRHYTSTGVQTLFIKLINNDTELTYSALLNALKEYNLDDNFPYLIRPNEIILQKINDLQIQATVIRYSLLGLSMLLFVTIVQSIYLLFQRNKFEYFLKKAFGHVFFQRFKNIFLLSLFTNSIEGITCFLFTSTGFYHIILSKLIIELLLASGLAVYFERRNVSNILKRTL